MKRIATVAILLIGTMTATQAMAWGVTKHTHYCNCGDSIGARMCGASTSSTSTGGTTTSSSTSSGGNTSSTTSSGGPGTSTSTSGGTPVPEPGMLGMMGLGFIGMAVSRRRRR